VLPQRLGKGTVDGIAGKYANQPNKLTADTVAQIKVSDLSATLI
jgi:hypothetical protein